MKTNSMNQTKQGILSLKCEIILDPKDKKKAIIENKTGENYPKTALSKYIPNLETPIKIICINLHVFQDGNGNKNWQQNDIPTLKQIIRWVNDTYTSPSAPSDPVGYNQIVSLLDSRIRFQLNVIEFYKNDVLNTSQNRTELFQEIYNRNSNFSKSVNIFFTNGPSGANATMPSTNLNFDSSIIMFNSYSQNPDTYFATSGILAHELAHILGLSHTYIGGGSDANFDQSHPDYLFDVFGNNPTTCPHISSWGVDVFDNTILNAEKYTNNIVGGCFPISWISALQAAIMHRSLETLSVSKYVNQNCHCLKCVGFSAQGVNHISAGVDQQLTYASTILDEGWSWNGSVFQVPVSGIYTFSIYFVKDAFSNNGTKDDVTIKLLKNTEQIGFAWSGEDSGKRSTGCFSINIRLEKNDKIKTMVGSDSGRQRHIASFGFNGHLICNC